MHGRRSDILGYLVVSEWVSDVTLARATWDIRSGRVLHVIRPLHASLTLEVFIKGHKQDSGILDLYEYI